MEGKSHCKLHYGDDGAVEEEIAEFYVFSSSYLTSDGSQIIAMQCKMGWNLIHWPLEGWSSL